MAPVEAFREPENRRERADGAPEAPPERAEPVVPPLRCRPSMIPGNEGDCLDLVRLEAAQVAVLDEVVGVLVVLLVTDMDADVVQERGVLEPLALPVREAVDAARLLEERD